MKLEHFGMAEPGDCRLVFTAGAEELAAAVAQVQAEPDAPQEEDGLLTEAVNRTILGGFSALFTLFCAPCKLSDTIIIIPDIRVSLPLSFQFTRARHCCVLARGQAFQPSK